MSDVKYDPEQCERLVMEAREAVEQYRRDPWRMSDPFVIAGSFERFTAMADQLEAARAEVERLSPVLDFATSMLSADGLSEFAVWKYKLSAAIDAYRAAKGKAGT